MTHFKLTATTIVACTLAIAHGDVSHAEFVNVINSPPMLLDELSSIGPNTQINVYDGSTTDGSLRFGNWHGPAQNIELNIYGGRINGSIYSGNWEQVSDDVVINMRGGAINGDCLLWDGAVAHWSGGTLGRRVSTGGSSRLHISGGDFRINGSPIAGLSAPGMSLAVNIPAQSILTGTLTDGTTFTLAGNDTIEFGDYIRDGTLTLHSMPIPIAAPTTYHLPSDAAPSGLRAGQTLNLDPGGSLKNNFSAGWGSVVNIRGGEVVEGFEAAGTIVNISAGTLGDLASAYAGSLINLSGGAIGNNFSAAKGSSVNVTGGTVGALFQARAGSIIKLSGGFYGDHFRAMDDSQITISGGEFRLNGIPVAGLVTGQTRQLNIPDGAVFSGTFADGTPFVFGRSGTYFEDGTLTLSSTDLPTSNAPVIQVPHSAAPRGLRSGQTLILSEGGTLDDNFTAGWGSSFNMTGGRVSGLLRATGAMVNISGGHIDGRLDAYYGSLVNVSGDTQIWGLIAETGSVINVSGGIITHHVGIGSGSVVNVSNGTIGSYGYAQEGSAINLSGGSIGDSFSMYGGLLNMTGGSIGDDFSGTNATVSGGRFGERFNHFGRGKLVGSDFRVDGVPVEGLMEYVGTELELPIGSVLSGTLHDGTPFAFSGQDGDNLTPGSLQLELRSAAPIAPATFQLPGSTAPVGLRAGQTLFVGAGGKVEDNFNANWGSVVTVTGGEIGRNFEAVGSQVSISGGEIGDGFDALFGSQVTVTGGSFVGYFDAHRGSVVTIHGGDFQGGITAQGGSVVDVFGGTFGYGLGLLAGSTINLFGTDFRLNGELIGPLVPGQPLTVVRGHELFTGVLADGSPLSMYLLPESFAPGSVLTVTSTLDGDYNGNGVVDTADYTVWRDSIGQVGSVLAADGNRNGSIDQGDYEVWRSQFGRNNDAASGVNSAIPEPSGAPLAIVAAAGVLLTQRQRRLR